MRKMILGLTAALSLNALSTTALAEYWVVDARNYPFLSELKAVTPGILCEQIRDVLTARGGTIKYISNEVLDHRTNHTPLPPGQKICYVEKENKPPTSEYYGTTYTMLERN